MKDKKVLTKAFTEMAPHYEETVNNELQTFWGWGYDSFIDELVEAVHEEEGAFILDLATGTGVIPRKLKNKIKGYKKILGLDITPKMLQYANRKENKNGETSSIELTCASAMQIPLKNNSIDLITCGLATHHMEIPQVLKEIRRVLKPGGHFVLADVAASPTWKNPVITGFLRVLAFFYFLPSEGISRAKAEAGALSNILTASEWQNILTESGFEIETTQNLFSKYFWAPKPLIVRAKKNKKKEQNMSTTMELYKQGRKNEIWTKYCGFLDLSPDEFMEIQERLLMEQIDLLYTSELGKLILGNVKPANMEEFRQMVPLSDYEFYAPYMNEKREDILPKGHYQWAHTSGRSTANGHKWVPYTKKMYDRLGEAAIGAMLLSSCGYKGEVNIEPNDTILLATAPPPYISGLLSYSTEEQFDLRFLPSLKEGEKMDFNDRISTGFELSQEFGLSYFYGIASVLAKIGERFENGSGTSSFSLKMLKPAILSRMIKGLVKAKLNKRNILPKDIWNLKGVMTGGTDTVIYRDQIVEYWGKNPLEGYACTEGGTMAMQTFTFKGMTFYPDSDFLEFIPYEDHLKSKHDPAFKPRTLLYNELEPGIYELVFTNLFGGVFTRYRVGDLFEVISLKDDDAGINLPQMRFYSRTGDLIDLAGLARLTEGSIWKAIESVEVKYEDWVARKEEIDGDIMLHIYLELKENNGFNNKDLEKNLRSALRTHVKEFRDFEELLGGNRLKVTTLPTGSWGKFMDHQKKTGADLAHIKPTHMQPSFATMKILLRNKDSNIN